MFVYNKQKSQNVESTMLKQVEIDTSRKSEAKSGIVIENHIEAIILNDMK